MRRVQARRAQQAAQLRAHFRTDEQIDAALCRIIAENVRRYPYPYAFPPPPAPGWARSA